MGRVSNRTELKCVQCEKIYSLPVSKSSKSKFCSRACKDINSTIHNKKANCLSCNTEFVVKKGKQYFS